MKVKSILNLFKDGHRVREMSALSKDYLARVAEIYDDSVQKSFLKELIRKYVVLEKKVDSLLKNTLPGDVAEEIKLTGIFPPRSYDCTILFTDLVGFTRLAESMENVVLIEMLDKLFRGFDDLIGRFKGTKIKTIGDAYMAVFGAPDAYEEHAVMAVKAAWTFLNFLDGFNRDNSMDIHMRVGIHTGEVMAGVVGKERMQFDVFGDNVNIAARFESSGEKGKINVSEKTYLRTRGYFEFEDRGNIALKNKESMKAYFVLREL